MRHIFYCSDARRTSKFVPTGIVDCVVTSPPYYNLRDYGIKGQIGLETSIDAYIKNLVKVFRDIFNLLKPEGTLWLNLGDTYAANRTYQVKDHKAIDGCLFTHGSKIPEGLKPKDLIGIPWRVALALQADGWYLRMDIIWEKPDPMPERVTDRPTKCHEYLFLFSKSKNYYYNRGGLYHRSVWKIPTSKFKGAHFATFPPDLAKRCIRAGCPRGGLVLDPFGGSGTVTSVAEDLNRNSIYIDLNPESIKLAKGRLLQHL